MLDVKDLFERQARWQRARQWLSWPEKIRLVEAIRESAMALRKASPACGDSRPDVKEQQSSGGSVPD
jgi:hypothetical protein